MAELPPPSACRACRRRIVWVHTEATGKAMPLDYTPTPDGNVMLVDDNMGRTRARVLGPLERLLVQDLHGDDAELFMPHHATCPDWLAAQTRKTKDKIR